MTIIFTAFTINQYLKAEEVESEWSNNKLIIIISWNNCSLYVFKYGFKLMPVRHNSVYFVTVNSLLGERNNSECLIIGPLRGALHPRVSLLQWSKLAAFQT